MLLVNCYEGLSRGSSGSNAEIKVVLGYGEEKKALPERLTGGHKELEVMSHIGMTNTLVDAYDYVEKETCVEPSYKENCCRKF